MYLPGLPPIALFAERLQQRLWRKAPSSVCCAPGVSLLLQGTDDLQESPEILESLLYFSPSWEWAIA